MISTRGGARAAVVAAAVMLAVGGAAFGQTHAPWPTDWNNWSDPALWVTVGNPGNAGELSGAGAGGYGPDRICGAVAYTYNIGKYEVTAGQYTAFLNAVGGVDTYGLYHTDMSRTDYGSGIARSGSSGNYTYSVGANFVNRPVNYVSWGDSARFANWLTNGQPTGAQNASTTEDGSYYLNGAVTNEALMDVTRKTVAQGGRYYIPAEDEWYKAAYYKGGGLDAGYWDYPTSSNTAPGWDMADPLPGNNVNYYTGSSTCPIDSGKFTTVAGEFENSDSPYGTFDQGGNVWEWNEAIISGSYRGVRGGSFYNYDFYLRAAHRYYDYVSTTEDNLCGFRVSEVPEPASALLLGIGGAVVAMKRRRAC